MELTTTDWLVYDKSIVEEVENDGTIPKGVY